MLSNTWKYSKKIRIFMCIRNKTLYALFYELVPLSGVVEFLIVKTQTQVETCDIRSFNLHTRS